MRTRLQNEMLMLTSAVNTVCTLELRAITNGGSETNDRRLVLLGLGSSNGVVNGLKIAISRSASTLSK